ncbi:MAG TPA: alpha/beta hydrolase, partial [Cyanobacteria bacterium UBA11049]|nr:alpha/beta hydrolase [Cyanobacteria bacterium UBA11049]
MSKYSTLTATIIRETKASEDRMKLMEQTNGTRFFLQPSFSEKVCLFFHGFTATPEQFIPLAQTFFQAGYSVIIPLLPGHGIAGEWDKDNPPPLPEDRRIYQEFGLHWLQIAQSLGEKVIVGGLSGSGTLVAWLALERSEQIYRTLAFAPFLSSSNNVVDLVVEKFNFYFKWRTRRGLAHFGYEGFFMPALRVFLDIGADVLAKAQYQKAAPISIVSSESDRAVDRKEIEALFEAALKFQPKCWYLQFDRDLHIPHTMMTEAEGNHYLDQLINLAKTYVESDLTWAE